MGDALRRWTRDGVALVGAPGGRVRFGFTERGGGVSAPPFASLNLGGHVGDDEAAVAENRRRALAALGAARFARNLLIPNQVHGERIVCAEGSSPAELDGVRAEIARGADAIVCTVPRVPVMLCFADCVPVVLTLGDAFAVAHSGWKGTLARIAGKTAIALAARANAPIADVRAYIGPHILGDEYEVSEELHRCFEREFDTMGRAATRMLDLGRAIFQSLEEAGVPSCEIHDPQLSTMRLGERFFSYRRERGRCGRHAAVAVMFP